MKKQILILIVCMFLITLVSANLGTFKQNDCVNIRTILNSTEVNISSISYPNGTVLYLNTGMTANGKTFNYSFCDTLVLGNYIYDYYDVINDEPYVNDFDISPSGQSGVTNIVFFLFIILMLYGITLIGFFGKNIPMSILGGMSLMGMGIYTINQGLIIYRDWLTNYFSYITIGLGALIAIWAAWEMVNEY